MSFENLGPAMLLGFVIAFAIRILFYWREAWKNANYCCGCKVVKTKRVLCEDCNRLYTACREIDKSRENLERYYEDQHWSIERGDE